MKMKKWMYNALIIFFAAVLVVSAGYLAYYYIDGYVQSKRYDDLSAMKETVTPRPSIPEDDTPVTDSPVAPQLVDVVDPKTGKTVQVLPEFADLYVQNSDIIGWMKIPGTDIDYPVMQTPGRTDYYLRRNFDKKSSTRGCLYARETCDVFTPGDNVTIYGHRMRDGTMFARLDNFMDQEYFEENPYIFFDTLTELHTYKVMAVFITTATIGEGFAYHEFENADDEKEFNKFVDKCKELSLYDTGVEAQYGDKLITLSTCEKSIVNGRLVVVAKRLV